MGTMGAHEREYLRCPACGRLTQAGLGVAGDEHGTGHRADVMMQTCVGRGRGGFQWASRPRTADETRALVDVLRVVLRRLDPAEGLAALMADNLRVHLEAARGELRDARGELRILRLVVLAGRGATLEVPGCGMVSLHGGVSSPPAELAAR